MNVILSGGGTGGHIYPALAIAEGLKEKVSGINILYVGTEKGLESHIVPQAGFAFQTINVSGINRSSMLKATYALGKFPWSIKQAWNIVKAFKPDLVIGTGGYVSFPVVFAASYYAGCKTFFHEQNAQPGLANRKLADRVDGALLTFEEAAAYLPAHKVKVTGLPVRKEIVQIYEQQRDLPKNFTSLPFQVIVFGGSRGAASINKAMLDLLNKYTDDDQIQFQWVTGTDHYESMKSAVRERLKAYRLPAVTLHPYLYDMGSVMAASQLAVCRAGASTISELALLGLPAILVPYPFAADGHQEKNARALSEKNAVQMVIDEFLDGNTLYNIIESLRHDEKRLHGLRVQLLKEAKPHALEDILSAVLA